MADKIVKKLEAVVHTCKGAHNLAEIYEKGKLVASFGIRRGSSKDQGHDHIPKDISVPPHFAKLLAQCPKSRADWIEKMKEIGVVDNE